MSDCDETQKELEALRVVADVAAKCCIDLSSNLKSANEEYMNGEIARGAFEHVLVRHDALHDAGYTEKHKFFDYPIKKEE